MDSVVSGVLKLHDLRFENIEFHRFDNHDKEETPPKINIHVSVSDCSNNLYKVLLGCILEQERAYKISIDLTGDFEIDNDVLDNDLKKKLLTQNTVAIMMPYLRSQITLLTAQPGFQAIVLPPINVQSIVNDKNETTN